MTTTITQLYKLVSANDYDSLEKLLMSNNNNIKFNYIKSGASLVTKAIEVRAVECFDLLINSNKVTILQSNSPNINGLSIAIEYYSTVPNSGNKYFIDRLLEKNVLINNESTVKCMHNLYLFDIMFNKIEKTENNLLYLLNFSILHSHTTVMYKLLNFLNDSLEFYNTPEKRYAYNIEIIKTGIISNNLLVFEYFKKIDTNILCVKNTNEIIPSLYYAFLQSDNNIIFNYIFSLYQKLDNNELQQINSIDKLSNIILLYNSYNDITPLYIEKLKKILSLPIKFTNLEDIIVQLYKKIYYSISEYNTDNNFKQFNNIQLVIFMLLKTNQVKVNPYTKLQLAKNDIECRKNNINKWEKTNTRIYNEYSKYFRKNKYILNNFGFIETDTMLQYYKSIFVKSDKTIYEFEEKVTIKEIENNYNSILNEKSKPVKARKTRKIPNDIVI